MNHISGISKTFKVRLSFFFFCRNNGVEFRGDTLSLIRNTLSVDWPGSKHTLRNEQQ
jgi:hypothetical protein